MTETPTLRFSTKILAFAVPQLKLGKVTQTIRSRTGVAPFFRLRGMVPLVLDNEVLYPVRITEVKSKPLGDHDEMDALLGGFKTLGQLQGALKRAGFRYMDLREYRNTFAVSFQPLREKVVQ